MKLYYDPISTTSRPIVMFAAEHRLPLKMVEISLLQGEQRSEAFLEINPNGCVPVLVDGSFTLTESSAILKYLAEIAASPAYPADLRHRARVNAAMDWFSTNFHSALGHGLAYPTLFPDLYPYSPSALAEVRASGAAGTARWFKVLNDHMIGDACNYVAGADLTLADYLGASQAMLAEAVGFELSPYPNVLRWLDAMKSRSSWGPTYAAFYGLIAALRPSAASIDRTVPSG